MTRCHRPSDWYKVGRRYPGYRCRYCGKFTTILQVDPSTRTTTEDIAMSEQPNVTPGPPTAVKEDQGVIVLNDRGAVALMEYHEGRWIYVDYLFLPVRTVDNAIPYEVSAFTSDNQIKVAANIPITRQFGESYGVDCSTEDNPAAGG